MLQDLLDFIDHHGIFMSITGDAIASLVMCAITTIMIYLLSYGLTGIIFSRVDYFKGIGNIMGKVRAILAGAFTTVFYLFLEHFAPILSLVYKWRYYIGTPILLIGIFILVGFFIYGKIQELLYPESTWRD